MNPNEPPAADQRRVAQLFLAALDGDRAAYRRAEAEVEAQPGAWKQAFSALAHTHVLLLIATYGEEQTRGALQAAALDCSLHEAS